MNSQPSDARRNKTCELSHSPAVFVWLGHLTRLVGQGLWTWLHGYMSRRLTRALLEPQGAVPQTLTLSGGDRFIAWCFRRPFLEECRWAPRHFWECRVYMGYGTVPGPIFKKPCAALVQLVGCMINTNKICESCYAPTVFLFARFVSCDLVVSSSH